MKILTIEKKTWNEGVDHSRKRYRLAGPVREQEQGVFRPLGAEELPDLSLKNTTLSPKSLVFPQSEVMFTYTQSDGRLVEAGGEQTPMAVLGIDPCDAKAISLLALNFDTEEYQDPYFTRALEACTLIGLAVNEPGPFDFSLSCGTGPFDETCLDGLLVDCDDHYLLKILTEKGEAWASSAGFDVEAEEGATGVIEQMRKEAESKIVSKISFDGIKEKTTLELYEADHWEETAFACINCGACTYACPTCWCFDIQDETDGGKGVRLKNWDSCMSSLFTLHSSGHNPREGAVQRTRQRFMHKLKYFADKYDRGIMCVGCGRCIKQCPANIDIRQVAETMNQR